MNYLDIFCFTSVARTGSFSITARELLISQQAVSRHIKVLEDELGFPLFLRNYQNVQLTEAGEQMLQLFLERDELLASYQRKAVPNTAEPTLHIGCIQWLGCPPWFQKTLDRFSRCYPDIHLFVHDLNAAEMHDLLVSGQMDILLTTRYAAAFLPVTWQLREFTEEPVFLLGAARSDHGNTPLSSYPFLGAYTGEPDETSVLVRLRSFCRSIGLQPRQLEILPDMGDVCLNVLLQDALAPVVNKPALADSPDYVLLPTNRTATCVLCAPYQSDNPFIQDFLRLCDESEATS